MPPTTFTTIVKFDHVRNTAAGFTEANPVLGYGVIGLEGDDESEVFRIKIGDGVTAWNDMPYAGGDGAIAIEDIEGLVAALAAKAPIASPTFTGTVGGVTKAMVGLGNVDNTSDASKPVSTATQSALDLKLNANDASVTNAREWTADTVDQSEAETGTATTRRAWTALRVFQAIAAWWAASAFKTKLDGIATGATANATDSQLRDRSTHDGTQAAGTITGLSASATTDTTNATNISSGTLAAARIGAHESSHRKNGADFPPLVRTTPAQITSNQSNLDISNADIARLSTDASRDIQGLTITDSVVIRNVGSFNIVLKNESGSASAAERRITVPWAGDCVVSPGYAVTVVYDSTTNRNVVLA